MRNEFGILILFVLMSCGFSEKKTHSCSSSNSVFNNDIENEHELDSVFVDKDAFPLIDTTSFNIFWETFQENLKVDKKEQVIDIMNFPIHAIYFVYFKYAYDCDTINYIRDEKKYYNVDIAKNEALKYYEFIFTDVLKEIICQTSSNDILMKGIKGKREPGIIYSFFPKGYNVKVNCPNDHNLKFYISYENNRWSISVTGI